MTRSESAAIISRMGIGRSRGCRKSIRRCRYLCREVQIAQVLLNLLQNAYDAAMDGPGPKWVRLDVEARDAGVVFSVTDSGPGVPLHVRHRIMEPFFTTKEVGKGTGLGLSISRSVVEEHGGELGFTEKDGNTCFYFRLPRL